jgi:hypothetical protein
MKSKRLLVLATDLRYDEFGLFIYLQASGGSPFRLFGGGSAEQLFRVYSKLIFDAIRLLGWLRKAS